MRRRAIVAGAATAGVAYHAGKKHQERMAEEEMDDGAYEEPQSYAPPPPAPAVQDKDPVAELERLGQLHESGVLTDEEFASAKARVLGS
jgi:hypothetical protein